MRSTRKIGTGVFAAAIAAALAFGGGTALAAQREAPCGSPGQACIVSAQCIQYCFPRGGFCNAGCCACNR